jgi:hypothetical protein
VTSCYSQVDSSCACNKQTLDVAVLRTIRTARVSKRTLQLTLLIQQKVPHRESACLRARFG